MLCLENEALPGIGGEYTCTAAATTDTMFVSRWPDLQSRPEFSQNTGSSSNEDSNGTITVTTNDLVALWIQFAQNYASDIKIENPTDIDEFTKFVDMTYRTLNDYGYSLKGTMMFTLSPDRNTGYHMLNAIAVYDDYFNNSQTQPAAVQHSPAVQEVFNSFEIVEGE